MKHSLKRKLKKYEWHLPYSKHYGGYLLNYYCRDKQRKYTKYSLAVYETKEDAADSFNYLTKGIINAYSYDIDFMFTTTRTRYFDGTKTIDKAPTTTPTDFDKLAEIVDRHNYNLPPQPKALAPELQAELDEDVEKLAELRPDLKIKRPGT